LSDPVVRREDGSWLYLLPSVIDDIDLGITHVVRGEDHVSNSAVQIQMFEALGAEAAAFAHAALLVAAEGKLSKRLGSYRSDAMREAGLEPMALAVASGADRDVAAGRAGRQPSRAGPRLRFRAFRAGAGAFRPS
jgi:glutamyl/glutaminyl-tRNA synthetase